MADQLKGRTVFITGSGGVLGSTYVRRMLAEGGAQYMLSIDTCEPMIEAAKDWQTQNDEYRVADAQNLHFLEDASARPRQEAHRRTDGGRRRHLRELRPLPVDGHERVAEPGASAPYRRAGSRNRSRDPGTSSGPHRAHAGVRTRSGHWFGKARLTAQVVENAAEPLA